ncbi:MAG: DUF2851 family protein [Ignavibacteriae bacterium]|nr:MAG: DUF2851 family protein [Ignavibacteriota bacterium]
MNRRTHHIHERFLRHIWSKQYLTAALSTSDGKSLIVFDVGRLNSDGGPDFRDAKIKINGVTYSGDVEIHRTVLEWLQHQHQEDPRYNKVILHVVLESAANDPPTIAHSGRQIPLLVLGRFLSESIQIIWQKAILDERAKNSETIPCFQQNLLVTPVMLDRWLAKLALERMELKLRRFEERLKQLARDQRHTLHEWRRPYGAIPREGEHDEIPSTLLELTPKDLSQKELWEQVLYEGMMEGLGYSKNREPFIRMARNVTLKELVKCHIALDDLDAMLFGVAGLLPNTSDIQERSARAYVRDLRKRWKRLRPNYRGELLHRADWQFFPTRPPNFPTIRLAAASALIKLFLEKDFFLRFIQILKSNGAENDMEQNLTTLFGIETHEFWNHHYHFDGAVSKRVRVLGGSRIREIIINTVLPVGMLYARIFKDTAVRQGALQIYRSLPAAENNSITRLMEKQLLKGRMPLMNVSRQQAVIQLYQYYCTENRCPDCELGAVIRP